jgi:transcriptional regulator NrdR family protein
MATPATDLERAGPHFVCPICGGQDWRVIDTRFVEGDTARRTPDRVYRRRSCRQCGYRISTHEIVSDHYL